MNAPRLGLAPFVECSPRHRCGICNEPGWCTYTTDGRVRQCMRVVDGPGARRKTDKTGQEFALYFAGSGPAPRTYSVPDAAPLASVDERHAVYSALLAALPLWPEHRDALLARGLADADVDARGYRSLSSVARERAQALAAATEALGGALPADVPGIVRGRLVCAPGLLIPVRDEEGRILALKIRADRGAAKYVWCSSGDQGASPGSPAHLPLGCRETLDAAAAAGGPRIVRITEGPLKADVATALSGVLTVGIPGATAIRTMLPALRALAPEVVRLAWDADARKRPDDPRRVNHVAGGLELAAHLLAAELPGVAIEIETWAASDAYAPKGIDDALAAGATLTAHAGQRAWRELVQILHDAGRTPRPETYAAAGMEAEEEASAPDAAPGADSSSHGGEPPAPPVDSASAPAPATPSEKGGDWRRLLITNARGVATKSLANAAAILENAEEWAGRFRWNVKQHVLLFDGRPLADEDLAAVRITFERRYGFDPGPEMMWDAMRTAGGAHPVNPVADYLTGLVWDGTPRLDSAAERFLGARGRLPARMLRMWMISAVARAIDPGCQVDTLIILIGNQGLRKSSFLRALAGSPWFSDSVADLANKDAFLQFAHAWIIEWGEFERILRRYGNDITKTMIPSRFDHYRPPYGKGIRSAARSCVFAGTTNKEQFLSDETGDRRYWCLRVTRAIDPAAVTAERDQLWAEAVVAFKAGEPWWFDGDEDQERARAAEIHAVDDPWLDAIASWIDRQTRSDFTTREVLSEALGIPVKDQGGRSGDEASRHVGKVMRRLKFRLAPWRPVRNGQRLKVTKLWVPEKTAEGLTRARIEAEEDGRVPGRGDAFEGDDDGSDDTEGESWYSRGEGSSHGPL